MSTLVLLIASVVAGATVLSVTQAWAAAGPSQHRVFRYFLAVLVSTTALTLAMLFLIGFGGELPQAHRNVAWSALGLASLTTAVVFTVGSRRRATTNAPDGTLWQRTWAGLPANIGLLAALGCVDMFILLMVFLGNIH